MINESSILLIKSSDPNNTGFGSGFVIHVDGKTKYILTCAHVVKELDYSVTIEGAEELITCVDEVSDLALIKVQDTSTSQESPLSLSSEAKEGFVFHSFGWIKHIRGRSKSGTLHGELGKGIWIDGVNSPRRVKAWDLILDQNQKQNELQHGYSGSPIFDTESNEVVGIISTMRDEAFGNAIDICELLQLWSDMPDYLRENLEVEVDDNNRNNYSQSRITNVEVRHEEIQDLVANDNLESALLRIIDFAKQFKKKTNFLHQAILLSRSYHRIQNNFEKNADSGTMTYTVKSGIEDKLYEDQLNEVFTKALMLIDNVKNDFLKSE